jgi:hypothetical protein
MPSSSLPLRWALNAPVSDYLIIPPRDVVLDIDIIVEHGGIYPPSNSTPVMEAYIIGYPQSVIYRTGNSLVGTLKAQLQGETRGLADYRQMPSTVAPVGSLGVVGCFVE